MQAIIPSSLKIIQVEYYQSDLDSILHCYHCERTYIKDGIMFYRSLGLYEKTSSNNILKWKDNYCALPELFVTKLECRANGDLITGDNICVYRLNKSEREKLNIFTGKILQCKVLNCELFQITEAEDFQESQGSACLWTHIYFEWMLINEKISIDAFADIYSSNYKYKELDQNWQEDISEFLYDI